MGITRGRRIKLVGKISRTRSAQGFSHLREETGKNEATFFVI